ncbi:MAG: extensin family protein [Tistlia sp.]|uniref:extensin family protein n=1 Tax=Tistlia sp. TaxID=3057121 RepID=UPI0034A2B04E
MTGPGRLLRASALIGLLVGLGGAPVAGETLPLPPLRPPELGGPDPVADWSDPDAPLQASPPKDRRLAPAAEATVAEAAAPEDAAPVAAEAAEAVEEPEHPPLAAPEGPVADEHESPPLDEAMAEERPAFELAETLDCEAELRRLGAVFTLAEPIEENGCGAERPLAVTALPGGIALEGPEVLLRCEAALAVARWIGGVVAPSAVLHLGTAVESLLASTSYHCRGRDGSATPSEHAFANALDVMGLRFADGSVMLIAPRPDSAAPQRAFQAAIRGGACAYFTTVIGPTTNAAHDDHLHLDVKRRSGGYRMCE